MLDGDFTIQNNPDDFNDNTSGENEEPEKEIKVLKKEEKNIFIIPHENNSGVGEKAPDSIAKKFNWGAFLFNWIWGIRYRKWVLLSIPIIAFIPFIGPLIVLGMSIWAGINGNQWAWAEVMYKNEKDFNDSQQSWVKAWFNLLILSIILSGIAFLLLTPKKKPVTAPAPKSELEYPEYNIPQEVYESTTSEDKFYNILVSDKYVIYWLRPQKEKFLSDKEKLEKRFAEEKSLLENIAVLEPEIVELFDDIGNPIDVDVINADKDKPELPATCENESSLCIEKWLHENCNTDYCIINPQLQKYIKVDDAEKVIPQVFKMRKIWE